MKTNRILLTAGIVLAIAAHGHAQISQSGYFTDQYTYRTDLNPAFALSDNFIAFPALGNLNVGMQSSLQVRDVLYNINGQTTTFLNPAVDATTFLNKLPSRTHTTAALNLQILGAGFKAFGGYNTISIGVKADVGASLPKSIFSLIKQGVENTNYDITNLNARATAYGEIAFGHSHAINKEWRVGGKLKFLLGGGNANINFDEARLTLDENTWTAFSRANVRADIKGASFKHKTNSSSGREYVSGLKVDGGGLNGFGLALDLGATYTPKTLRDWEFSAAVLDFGFISWGHSITAATDGEEFTTDKYTFNVDSDAPNSFKNEWKKMRSDLEALYQLTDEGTVGSHTTMVATTLRFGAKYTLPAYRRLSFGLLNTTRLQGQYTWTDFRLSANVAPLKMLSATANIALGTYGFSFGWMLNIHPKGFNLFAGMDHTTGKLAKQGLPLSGNAQFNMGINFPF